MTKQPRSRRPARPAAPIENATGMPSADGKRVVEQHLPELLDLYFAVRTAERNYVDLVSTVAREVTRTDVRASIHSDSFLIVILQQAAPLAKGEAAALIDLVIHLLQARQIDRASTSRKNATTRRTKVTRAALAGFRTQYIVKESRERGWKTAACKAFQIDAKTLKGIWE